MSLAEDILDSLVETYAAREADFEQWDLDALKREVNRVFAVETADLDFSDRTSDEIRDKLWEKAVASYDEKEKLVGRDVLQRVERDIMLQIVDAQWKDHLYSLDHLKEGIGLRGYGQRDPLVEYKTRKLRAVPGDEGSRGRGDRPVPVVAAADPDRRGAGRAASRAAALIAAHPEWRRRRAGAGLRGRRSGAQESAGGR